MKKNGKLVFLYSELAGYFLSCLRQLRNSYPELEIHVFRWPLNKEAPFSFHFPNDIHFYSREEYQGDKLIEKVKDIDPSFIYCSGWMDKQYVKVCNAYKGIVPTVLGMDTPWRGKFKQWLRILFLGNSIKRSFSHCWVPGRRQKAYANKLGFSDDQILMGFYSADQPHFYSLFEKYSGEKRTRFPHRFLYTGRYVESKGVQLLWDAFAEVKEEFKNDWELWCLGTGNVEPVNHPAIRHFGFVQPSGIENFVKETGVFVLPSNFEPWGVVVHEFAAAGFPMICSDQVGATEAFVEYDKNGFIFNQGDKEDLKRCLKGIMSKTDSDLIKMGEKSAELSFRITPETWVAELFKSLN